MYGKEHLEDFLSIVNAWKFGYTKVLTKYFVIKNETERNLLYGFIGFSNENLGPLNFHFETEHCIAGQEIAEFSNEYYKKLLFNLKKKPHVLMTRGGAYNLPIAGKEKCRFYFEPMNFPSLNPTMRSPYLRVMSDNNTMSIPSERTLELELRSCETPFDNLQDFYHAAGLPPDLLRGADSAKKIHLVATMPISNMTYKIENRKSLEVKFWFPRSPDRKKFKVGVRTYTDTPRDLRFTVAGKDLKWGKEKGSITAILTHKFDALNVARIFPSYSGHNIGSVDRR